MPQEQVITIRQPATANLMIDSADRNDSYSSPFDFQITKPAALMNGFFSRIGTTEVVLEWCEHNITDVESRLNTKISFDLSGSGGNTYADTQVISLLPGSYTVADTLDAIVVELNDLSGTTGMTFLIEQYGGATYLQSTGGSFKIPFDDQAAEGSVLASQLEIIQETFTGARLISCPDLRPYRYIDFVSQQLTYNQDLKDATSNNIVRDVLCRWYFDDDVPEALDAYGFPILMGYKNFCRRRTFSPPKQIRWSNNQSIGNLSFQVYGWIPFIGLTLLPIVPDGEDSNWLMTLQMSEN